MRLVWPVFLALMMTGCGACDAPQRSSDLIPETWPADGREMTLENALVEPRHARSGETVRVVMILPPSVEEVAVTMETPQSTCTEEIPCSLGPEWSPLSYDQASERWVGEVEVPENAAQFGTLYAEIRVGGALATRRSYGVGIDRPGVEDGSVLVRSAADVDALCTEEPCDLELDIIVANSEFEDLTVLAPISSTGGTLRIVGNSRLTTLSGLEDLEVVGGLELLENPALETVEAARELTIFESLVVSNLPRLADVGLLFANTVSPVTQARIEIREMVPLDGQLERLPFNSSVKLSTQQPIEFSPRGTYFIRFESFGSGLRSLDGIHAGELNLRDQPNLEALSVVFEEVPSRVYLSVLPELETLTLEGDVSVASIISIAEMENLSSIEGLDQIRPGTELTLSDIPNLSRCEVEMALDPAVLEAATIEDLGPCS